MEQFEEAIRILRRRWQLIPLTAIVALLVVLAVDFMSTARYRTRARYLVAPVVFEDPGDLVDSTEALRNTTVTATFAEIFNSPTLQQEATASAQIAEPEAYEVNTVVLPETNVLQVTVTGPDPELAQGLANNLGQEVVEYLGQFTTIYQLHELDPAPLVEEPYAPQLLRDAVLALVLGAALGVVLALGLPFLLSLISLASLPEEHPQHAATVGPRQPGAEHPAERSGS